MARGDRIFVKREFLQWEGVYNHYGIDCGDGTVIHYRKPSEAIERTSFATFARGQKVYAKRDRTSFVPDVVISRAMSRLGEKKYNLLFNNCEHFANWCKFGISESEQVKKIFPAIDSINPTQLEEPLREALKSSGADNAEQLVNEALGSIKLLWDDLQPRYKKTIGEIQVWEKVAQEALRRDREDLAREAIRRKLKHKKEAKNLEEKLEKLAKMTETLIRNSQK